jgi:hypothetical protein
MSSAAHHSRDSLFYSKRAVARQRVNLKLEAGASESSPPSQSESSARALPDPDALTAEIFMTPPKRQKGWLTQLLTQPRWPSPPETHGGA